MNDAVITIKRYSQPDIAAWTDDTLKTNYSISSYTGALFHVADGASLTISNMVIDGHSEAYNITGADYADRVNANGVEAEGALVQVDAGGNYEMNAGTVLQNNKSTANGGAISNSGSVTVYGGTVSGNEAAKGAGIYQNGTVNFNASSLTWDANQGIYLTAPADLNDTELAARTNASDGKVSYITVSKTLPAGVTLNVTIDEAHGAADGRPIAKAASDSVTLDKSKIVLTKTPQKLSYGLRLDADENALVPNVLELQSAGECIIDVVVPMKGEETTVTNYSSVDVTIIGDAGERDVEHGTTTNSEWKNVIKIICGKTH